MIMLKLFRKLVRAILAFSLAVLTSALTISGAVTKIEVAEKRDLLNGSSVGSAGAYEAISGRVHFAVDPNAAENQGIADLRLAPRNNKGEVESSADFFLVRPKVPSRSNGTALVEISNRGGKSLFNVFDFVRTEKDPVSGSSLGDAFLLQQGFTLVWIGWEFDIPPSPNLLHLYVPVATTNGKVITGLVRSEWIGDTPVQTIPLGDRAQTGYSVADPNAPVNQMFVRDKIDGPRTRIARSRWTFVDETHVRYSDTFAPGRIYEIVYLAKNPPVAGLGFSAVRDFVSFLKFGGPETPLGGPRLKRSLAFGVSQSGRFLRAFLYEGFNQDEQHRQVFDGVWAHVAGAGRGSFNERWAQPSRDGCPFFNVDYPVDVPPFDEAHLLAKSRQTHTAPKLFLTNGAYEYWGRVASLIHTTEDGAADVMPSVGTRIYFFTGGQHFAGAIPPRPAETQNRTAVNDYRFALRALLVDMQQWLATGANPPPSRFPLIADHQLVDLAHFQFPQVPGLTVPTHKREAYRLDFSVEPPKIGSAYLSLVPRTDANGNDFGGVAMPEVAVPLASNTGWDLRSPKIGAPDRMASFYGSWLPLPKTNEDRRRSGDSRAAAARLYPTQSEYLRRIDQAAQRLAGDRFLMKDDLPAVHLRAAQEWQYFQGRP